MNRLYLVRHGENWANITKEFSHRYVDYSLTKKGIEQAQQTAAFFAGKDIHAVYSSPLKRAIETAEIIAAGIEADVVVMENFREVNVGVLERQPVSDEIWAVYLKIFGDWYDGHSAACFPGGEDYFTLLERMQRGLQHIFSEQTGLNAIAVGHGGIFSVTLKDICHNIEADWLRSAENHNCSITEVLIEIQEQAVLGQLINWASYAHLHGAAADLISGVPQSHSRQDDAGFSNR